MSALLGVPIGVDEARVPFTSRWRTDRYAT
jgi:hypothetical protein